MNPPNPEITKKTQQTPGTPQTPRPIQQPQVAGRPVLGSPESNLAIQMRQKQLEHFRQKSRALKRFILFIIVILLIIPIAFVAFLIASEPDQGLPLVTTTTLRAQPTTTSLPFTTTTLSLVDQPEQALDDATILALVKGELQDVPDGVSKSKTLVIREYLYGCSLIPDATEQNTCFALYFVNNDQYLVDLQKSCSDDCHDEIYYYLGTTQRSENFCNGIVDNQKQGECLDFIK